jgi:hypothetical protein
VSSNRRDYVSSLKGLMKCLRAYAKFYRMTNGDVRFYWWLGADAACGFGFLCSVEVTGE